jgi:hypothetical protein
MKTIITITLVALSLFAGGLAFASTDNLIVGSLTSYSTSFVLQTLTGISIQNIGSFNIVLAALKTTEEGTPNPGGGRKVWIAAKTQFASDWGHESVEGEIVVAPPMVANNKFVEIEVADNSLKFDQNLKGAAGYQSIEGSFEVKLAGDYKAQTLAVEKLINTEVVAVFQENDLQRKVIGSTIFPLTFEISHTTGAKGSDPRGWTLKAKQDGLPKFSNFLATTVVIPV